MPSAQRAGPSSTGAARVPPPAGQPSASGSPTAWLLHRPWAAKASTLLSHQYLVATPMAGPARVLSSAPCALPSTTKSLSLIITAVRGPARNKHGQRDTLPTVPSVRGLTAEFPHAIQARSWNPAAGRTLSGVKPWPSPRRGGAHRGKQRSRLTAPQPSPPQKPAQREAAAPLCLILLSPTSRQDSLGAGQNQVS